VPRSVTIKSRSDPCSTHKKAPDMQTSHTSAEVLAHLARLGFSPESLIADKETRNLARAAINKLCRTKWANGRLTVHTGPCDHATWDLYTAKRGNVAEIKIPVNQATN